MPTIETPAFETCWGGRHGLGHGIRHSVRLAGPAHSRLVGDPHQIGGGTVHAADRWTEPSRQLGCADYLGVNASHPYPGADELLQGCPDINRLSIADAVALVEIGKNGHVDKKSLTPTSWRRAGGRQPHLVAKNFLSWETRTLAIGCRPLISSPAGWG